MTLTDTEAAELFRAEPDGYLDVGAGEAAYRRIGTGPDVLFIHGWPVSGATWRKLLPHLADHVTCHIVDLPSAGSSRFDSDTPMSIRQHVESVRRIVDLVGVDDISVVAHDSGGMIARHALAGDPRVRAMGLINTEPSDPSWRFRSFLAVRKLPGLAAGLGWVAGKPRVRRTKFVFGDAFVDRSLLEGEFAEFFFDPLHESSARRVAAAKLLSSFDMRYVTELPDVHARIDVPVKLVWGDRDPFFPVARAKAMVNEFPNATIDVLPGVGLFSHEEAPADVARSLLPTLLGVASDNA
jgi:pimeloyl-ACP methyl ester carboxylesterase